MDLKRLEIPDVLVLTPRRIADERGYFSETWSERAWREAGLADSFVQDNLSLSRERKTLRGLHFQRPPHAQAKLVSVLLGRVLDVAVDIRRGSPWYGRHVAYELSAQSGAQLYAPLGFLHGFLTLEPSTLVAYKVSDRYAADCDGGVRWNDPGLAIDWGVSAEAVILSPKDAAAPLFADFESPFVYQGRTGAVA
jgi:dTDP-4-dehydrorhamnose 3,5-epimerase